MKLPAIIFISALLASAHAHYLFGRLILDGKWTTTWEYVRQVQPKPDEDAGYALVYPQTDPSSVDLRCGRNASDFKGTVKTATVHAGDTVGFAVGEPAIARDLVNMYHEGFASAWLSKAPSTDLNAYTGDGDWFKILSVTNRTEQSLDYSKPENAPVYDPLMSLWGTYGLDSYNFTIPRTTPPGKYLLRFEHIFPIQVVAQYYVNCAQVEVVNPSTSVGTPAPLVKIPGIYTRGQPDVYFTPELIALANNYSIDSFVPPAPAVWRG